MSKWIEILKAGEYPQGNISVEDLQLMAQFYDPAFQQAPFIPEHRKFDGNGELVNNMSALGWVKAVRVRDNVLEVLPEDESTLEYIYDGKAYKYASAEIETVTIEGKTVPYLGAIAATNFPASKIKQIKLNGKPDIKVYTQQFKLEDEIMNKEQFTKLCKALEMKDGSTSDEVITKLTQMISDSKKNGDGIEKQLSEIVKLIKADPSQQNDEVNDSIKKLTDTVNSLLTKFDQRDADDTESVFAKAVNDKKVLPSQKELLVGTKDKPGTFYKNVSGLKSFVDTLPVLTLTKQIDVPKDGNNKSLTYSALLNSPKAYAQMQKENPALFTQLREDHFSKLEAKTPTAEEK